MRAKESGMVLVQVLGTVAVASAIAITMLAVQERAARYALNTRDRIQAEALALAGETSVMVAFRRDGESNPLTDHYGEIWYSASQAPVDIPAGSFSVTIRDAQAKFNLNRLASGVSDRVLFNRIASAAGVPPETGDRIATALAAGTELKALSDLIVLGIPSEDVDALSPWVTILPQRAQLNLNTADAGVVRAVLANPSAASQLIARREARGGLDFNQLGEVGILLPPGTGLVTGHLEIEVSVQVGSSSLRLQSLISREQVSGKTEALVVARRWG